MAKKIWKPGNMLNPVPAVMVSAAREGEKPNICTIAWAGTVCSDPPMVSISVRPERYTYGIIKDTGAFVVNLADEKLARALDWCGVRSGRDFDKFAETGLTAERPEGFEAPAIAESPVSIHCRVTRVLPLGSHDMFLAEVTGVAVSEELIDEKNALDLEKAGLVAYSHGVYHGLGKAIGKFGFSVKK